MISRGIVIEVAGNYGIVLNDEGIYERIARKGSLSEGDRIIYTRDDIFAGMGGGDKKILTGLMSAALVILTIGIAFVFETLPVRNVYASASMDANTSIQYFLDKNELVLGIEAMNGDGQDTAFCGLKGLGIGKDAGRTPEEA